VFSLHTLLTVSKVPFLFEHLFTYCAIDSDLKGASFILFHSLLSQFNSVLKWGNSSRTTYLLCRISVIACVCNCLLCRRFLFSVCLFFSRDVFIYDWRLRALNNPVLLSVSSSSRTEALGTPLCPHLAWLRRCWRSSSCCIL